MGIGRCGDTRDLKQKMGDCRWLVQEMTCVRSTLNDSLIIPERDHPYHFKLLLATHDAAVQIGTDRHRQSRLTKAQELCQTDFASESSSSSSLPEGSSWLLS